MPPRWVSGTKLTANARSGLVDSIPAERAGFRRLSPCSLIERLEDADSKHEHYGPPTHCCDNIKHPAGHTRTANTPCNSVVHVGKLRRPLRPARRRWRQRRERVAFARECVVIDQRFVKLRVLLQRLCVRVCVQVCVRKPSATLAECGGKVNCVCLLCGRNYCKPHTSIDWPCHATAHTHAHCAIHLLGRKQSSVVCVCRVCVSFTLSPHSTATAQHGAVAAVCDENFDFTAPTLAGPSRPMRECVHVRHLCPFRFDA